LEPWVNSSGISDNLTRAAYSQSNGCRGLGSLPSLFVSGQLNWKLGLSGGGKKIDARFPSMLQPRHN